MSFFRNLFSFKITYAEYVCKDKNYPELIHVFGARRVMPDEGDSFDIWHHRLINADDFSVTDGIKQQGNEFNIKSDFAKRALKEMAAKLNRNLAFDLGEEEQDYEEEEEEYEEESDDSFDAEEFEEEEPEEEYQPPAKNVFRVYLHDSRDTDTAVLPKTPRDGIVLTTVKNTEREQFTVQVFRYGQSLCSHRLKGMGDYFRHEMYYPEKNKMIMTYRKEGWSGNGGMGFYVLNLETGELIFDGYIV